MATFRPDAPDSDRSNTVPVGEDFDDVFRLTDFLDLLRRELSSAVGRPFVVVWTTALPIHVDRVFLLGAKEQM